MARFAADFATGFIAEFATCFATDFVASFPERLASVFVADFLAVFVDAAPDDTSLSETDWLWPRASLDNSVPDLFLLGLSAGAVRDAVLGTDFRALSLRTAEAGFWHFFVDFVARTVSLVFNNPGASIRQIPMHMQSYHTATSKRLRDTDQ